MAGNPIIKYCKGCASFKKNHRIMIKIAYTEEPKDHQHFVTFNSKYNNLVTSDKHLLWVDTSYDEKGMACLDEDRTNITEAKLIAQALVKINEQMRQQGFGEKSAKGQQKVGVVSFYQAQCLLS